VKLKWDSDTPASLPNLETEARRLRYQALGKECAVWKLDTLILAHHADDQAETILQRLHQGHTGFALQGMLARSPIPECFGNYGVATSGAHRNFSAGHSGHQVTVEGGGVEILRPLLDFSKAELQAVCRERKLRWVEDSTNADPTVTNRNAVRSLLRARRLPRAISTRALQKLGTVYRERAASIDNAALSIFKQCNVVLDVYSGRATVKYPGNIQDLLLQNPRKKGVVAVEVAQRHAACLIRHIMDLVSPQQVYPLRLLRAPVLQSFPFLFQAHEIKDVGASVKGSMCNVVYHIGPEQAGSSKDELGAMGGSKHIRNRCEVSRAPPTQAMLRRYHDGGEAEVVLLHPADSTPELDEPRGHEPALATPALPAIAVDSERLGQDLTRDEREDVKHGAEGVGEEVAAKTEVYSDVELGLTREEQVRAREAEDIPTKEKKVASDWRDQWKRSRWKLFDGRFWIRVHYREVQRRSGQKISVRFLTTDDLAVLYKDVEGCQGLGKRLSQRIASHAPDAIRLTLPAIVETSRVSTSEEAEQVTEKVVALPTMQWSSCGWVPWSRNRPGKDIEGWQWELRYKKIDFSEQTTGSQHELADL